MATKYSLQFIFNVPTLFLPADLQILNFSFTFLFNLFIVNWWINIEMHCTVHTHKTATLATKQLHFGDKWGWQYIEGEIYI